MSNPLPSSWIARAAARTPEAVALVGGGRSMTYGDLHRATRRALPGAAAVPVVARRRADSVVEMWRGWASGTPVIPLDPDDPDMIRAASQLRPAPASNSGAGPDAPHTIVYTSGSTGHRRAAVLTGRNVAAAVAASQERLGTDGDDRWLLVLPLFHVGGLSVLWRSAAAGGTVVLQQSFDPAVVAAAFHTGRITVASLVPTMLQRVLDHDPGPYPKLKAVLVGGAAAAPDLVERALAAGLPCLATYGMTETCAQATTVVPGREGDSIGTSGLPLREVQVTITDESGRAVPDGVIGEIVVSGPTVSPGYAGERPRTGALRTGDLGLLDPAGRLVVVGRVDDMIVSGGENVHPARVESVLISHPRVHQAVVFGRPDPEWGQVVCAAIVAAAGVSATDLAQRQDRSGPGGAGSELVTGGARGPARACAHPAAVTTTGIVPKSAGPRSPTSPPVAGG
jgi:O-succinylbenzoic acid--CoA ligase